MRKNVLEKNFGCTVNIAKLQFAQGLHTAFQLVQDIAGGLLVTYPSQEDLVHAEYGPAVQRYLGGPAGVDGIERLRVLNLVSDLTTGEFGGYQAVLAIHAEGSIEAEKLTIVAQYPREEAMRNARWLAGLGEGVRVEREQPKRPGARSTKSQSRENPRSSWGIGSISAGFDSIPGSDLRAPWRQSARLQPCSP